MFSFKETEENVPIAKIKGDRKKRVVYLNKNLEETDQVNFNKLQLNYGLMQKIPNRIVDREVVYISGPSGAGKSTWCSNYIEEYKKVFPKNEIVLFSRKPEDPALDIHNPLRIDLDQSIVDDPIDLTELQDSLVIFDDCATINNKKVREAVLNLMEDVLECGRSYHISILATSHQLMNYKETRTLLNEATQVVFFPNAGSQYHVKRFLKVYCGLDRDNIKTIMKLPTRYCMINKSYPNYLLYEFGLFKIV